MPLEPRRNVTRMAPSISAGPTDTPLLLQTIGENLRATARRFPEREALVVCHQGVRQTWADLDATVDAAAKALMGLGIEKGDRVGMWSPASISARSSA